MELTQLTIEKVSFFGNTDMVAVKSYENALVCACSSGAKGRSKNRVHFGAGLIIHQHNGHSVM